MKQENFKRIIPANVNRNAKGFWSHPEYPAFDEGEDDQYKQWVKEHQLVVEVMHFESDAPEALCEKWFAGKIADCRLWEPSMPDGKGWFILGIWDTEDGPVCYWARYIEGSTENDKEVKEVTTLYATDIRFRCPHCREIQEGWLVNPSGGDHECDECGKPYRVHPSADIRYGNGY